MQALEALFDLQRKFADRLAYSWPDKEIEKRCEAFIKKIKNIFTSNVEDIDFSNIVQSEFLSNILYRYIAFDDNKFSQQLIEQLSAWYCYCKIPMNQDGQNACLNKIEDSSVLKKIFKLFKDNNVNKQIISNNLLYSYLELYKKCSNQFIGTLHSFLKKTGIIDKVDLYFNTNKFEILLSKEVNEKENYANFLISNGIKPKFVKTSYFNNLWFDWVILCANVLSEKFLSEMLQSRINSIDIDKKKVILAYIANKIDKVQNNKKKDHYFKDYLLPLIGKNNPLHEEYWKVNDKLYEKYKTILDKATTIFRKYYVSEFISIFFDALENTGGDRSRAIFWKKYKNRINDFALGLKDYDSRTIKNYIRNNIPENSVNSYLEVLSEFTLRLSAPKSNTPAVLVLSFDSIIIIEFSVTGNATYIYRNNPNSHWNYLKADDKYNEDDFKNKLSPNFIDTFHHRGFWQNTFGGRLRRDYHIEP